LELRPLPITGGTGPKPGRPPTFFFGVPAGQVDQPDGISRSVDAFRKLFGSHDRFAARAHTFTVRSETLPMEDATQTLGGVWGRDYRRLDKQEVLVPSRYAPPPSPPPRLLATPNGCVRPELNLSSDSCVFSDGGGCLPLDKNRRSHKVAFASDQATRQCRPRWGI
jgi:hypothetical protein